MNLELLKGVEGERTSAVHAVFFCGQDGVISDPISIILHSGSSGWLEISSDGNGKIKYSSNIFERLYFDDKIGFSFVAPILIAANGKVDGSEEIKGVRMVEEAEVTSLIFDLHEKNLKLRFEDDNVCIEIV
ncbi:hypothetical protein [Roseovarius rhodophyticola]|uniref:Uncharacterized protein n=1 Tax=Roseovarius rhodophyticola TaxID=3080827 RepID=A0ABZ2TF39_9RHOB|nr:hypothetical protein [Roseovarius sp. W115]MDV2928558.1 hypothetical protein [Roseovarius sp. W115]